MPTTAAAFTTDDVRTDATFRRRRLTASLLSLGVTALLLSGCAPFDPGTPATKAPQAPAGEGGANDPRGGGSGGTDAPTESEAPTGEATDDDDQGDDDQGDDHGGNQAGEEQCGVAKDDPRIQEAIAHVPAPFTDPSQSNVTWSTTVADTNFDPCAEFSYALLTIDGATSSSPMQVMLFSEGEYLGTTSDCAPGWQSVRQNDDDSIMVTYEWPKDGGPNAGAKDSKEIQYSLIDGSVSMSEPLPDQVISEGICHTWPPQI